MHSFHPTRERILFEVFCALAIAASCVGAWMQTGAWALLPGAFAAALYGLFHTFDLARPNPTVTVDQPNHEVATEAPGDVLEAPELEPLVAKEPERDVAVGETEPLELAAPQESAPRRTKAPRKAGSRRASAPKEAKVIEAAPAEEVEVAVFTQVEEVDFATPVDAEEAEVVVPLSLEQAPSSHVEQLFEPEPFGRQQRAVFGRKAR
jgi:hypothetical protein